MAMGRRGVRISFGTVFEGQGVSLSPDPDNNTLVVTSIGEENYFYASALEQDGAIGLGGTLTRENIGRIRRGRVLTLGQVIAGVELGLGGKELGESLTAYITRQSQRGSRIIR